MIEKKREVQTSIYMHMTLVLEQIKAQRERMTLHSFDQVRHGSKKKIKAHAKGFKPAKSYACNLRPSLNVSMPRSLIPCIARCKGYCLLCIKSSNCCFARVKRCNTMK